MIIAEGTSSRHVNSIAQKIIEFLKNKKVKKVSTEGLNKSEWVLIDAGDILIHLFLLYILCSNIFFQLLLYSGYLLQFVLVL